MSRTYQISTRTMLSHISKLNLQQGDVIVCSDYQTLDYLSRVQLPLGFTVPLVFSPNGVEKLNRQDLLNLIEQLDQAPETPASVEMPSAPL
jgi:hypothetical protein